MYMATCDNWQFLTFINGLISPMLLKCYFCECELMVTDFLTLVLFCRMPHKKATPICMSPCAANTLNPIRKLVDHLVIKPNPEKEFLRLSIGSFAAV